MVLWAAQRRAQPSNKVRRSCARACGLRGPLTFAQTLRELIDAPEHPLAYPTILYRLQRSSMNAGTVTVGPLKLPPRGVVTNRFDLPHDDLGYFAETDATAVYETLARREATTVSVAGEIATREMLTLQTTRRLEAGKHQAFIIRRRASAVGRARGRAGPETLPLTGSRLLAPAGSGQARRTAKARHRGVWRWLHPRIAANLDVWRAPGGHLCRRWECSRSGHSAAHPCRRSPHARADAPRHSSTLPFHRHPVTTPQPWAKPRPAPARARIAGAVHAQEGHPRASCTTSSQTA